MPIQKELYKKYGEQLEVSDAELFDWLSDEGQAVWGQLKEAAGLERQKNQLAERALVVLDRQAQPAAEYLLDGGRVTRRSQPVSLGFLEVMTRGKSSEDYWAQVQPQTRDLAIDPKWVCSATNHLPTPGIGGMVDGC